MQITVNSQALAAELRLLNQVVATKPALAILMNVLIRADDVLHFATTDLEIAFTTTCPATISEAGVVTLPVKKLLDIVEQLPNADVIIKNHGHHVWVLSGSFQSRLQAMPADDFPAIPVAEGEATSLPTALLQQMIGRVRYAISDKGKYTINGALLSLTEKVAGLVSTDGMRVAITTMTHRGRQTSVVLPTKALDALAMFNEASIDFSQSGQHLFFQSGDRLLASRMIEAKFPAYERIIPDNDKKVVINRLALAAALRRVGLVSEDNMACYFAFESGVLDLNSSSAAIGDATERVNVRYDNTPIKICCNWRFVLDFLEVAVGETVVIALKDRTNSMLLTDGENHLAVVVLMRSGE